MSEAALGERLKLQPRPGGAHLAVLKQMARHEGGTMVLSQLVQEVRELYLSKIQPQPETPVADNAMSPRVMLIKLTQKFIEKYTMVGLVKSEPLSDDEDWNRPDWDMNLLEPMVEISDQPNKNNSRKRKRNESSAGPKKRGKPPSVAKVNGNHVNAVIPSDFLNVSIKEEPADPAVPVLVEDGGHTVPMATIPVDNSTSSMPVYVYVPQPQPVVLQHPVGFPVENTNVNTPSTSETNVVPSEAPPGTNIKQEEMENVFVMPFRADIQDDRPATRGSPALEPDIIACDSPEVTARKIRTAAIAQNIGTVNSFSSHKNLRDLTFRLVELNNKNLQCDTKMDKIREEFKKRLQVVEIEKKGIEQEIDSVLASIQAWKEGRHGSSKV